MKKKGRRKLDKLNKMAIRLQIIGTGHYILFFFPHQEKKRNYTEKKGTMKEKK